MREMPAPFACDAEDVAEAYATQPATGLSGGEAAERLRLFGPNRLHRQKTKSALAILVHQFNSIIVWLLAIAAGFSVALGDLAEGIAIVVVLIINSAIGFFTEFHAARSMESLVRLSEVRTRVRRDGRKIDIDAREVAPGDVVVLEAGDIVAADLRLVGTSNLQCDESLLTGESTPVIKNVAAAAPDAEIADRANMAFSGTSVTQGKGEGIAVATGMATELGRISALAQEAEQEFSPLEKRLDRLGHKLVWMTLLLVALTSVIGILRGFAVPDMIETGIALAVAAVPEGLPVVATLCLARGMWRMAARNALITQLSSVETLGATTLILTDKTGTLTENRMSVTSYLLDGGDIGVEREGEKTSFSDRGGTVDPNKDRCLLWALRIGALCNSAELGEGPAAKGTGDPMEVALLQIADAAGITSARLAEVFPKIGEYPFDPQHKAMATVIDEGGRYLYAVKGAPEAIIDLSGDVLTCDGRQALDAGQRRDWRERSAQAAGSGLRVLALAMKSEGPEHGEPYAGLTLVGLVCFHDPLREDIPPAIEASHEAGVRVVMMTGDHAETASSIARSAGIGTDCPSVLEGRELADIDTAAADPRRRDRILSTDVFARVTPEAKLKLVTLFQESGQIVAMTGDGVNDAPALKKADIGIAMGLRGTPVAREASDMVLKDDAFTTIVAAMHQGRIIFENIRKFVLYLMSCNVSEVLVVGIAVGIGLPSPLLPLQILFLNLVTDVFPAFALGLGKGDDAIMRRPPRDPSEPIVGRSQWMLIALLGILITIATLAAFAVALFLLDYGSAEAVTVAFLTLALAQLWNAFNVRGARQGLLLNEVTRNFYLWAALILCCGLIAIAVLHPGLSALLGLPLPGPDGLVLAGGMSLLPLAIGQIYLLILEKGQSAS